MEEEPDKVEPEWVLPGPVGRPKDAGSGGGEELRFKGPTLFIVRVVMQSAVFLS